MAGASGSGYCDKDVTTMNSVGNSAICGGGTENIAYRYTV
jgi:hypothetical protein